MSCDSAAATARSGVGGGAARAFAARHGERARARHLQHPVGLEHFEQAIELGGAAGELEHQRIGGDVDDAGAEDVGELEDLRPRGGGRGHLDERQLADHVGPLGDVVDTQHVDQLVEVRLDVVRPFIVGIDDDRHARDPRCLGAADRERFDVVGAAAEERGHAREHARLVLDEHDEGDHWSAPVSASTLGRRIMLCRSAPAGTIG